MFHYPVNLRLFDFRYKDLHVFQIEHPTKVLEWTGDKSKSSLNLRKCLIIKVENPLNSKGCFSFCIPGICVAGYTGARSEILELLLPLKLYAGENQVNKETSSLCILNVQFI